jgi:hypothetical protein
LLTINDDLIAKLRRAITRLVTGSDGARELTETWQRMNARMPVSVVWSSEVARAFRALWRSTPRLPSKTEQQWEAAYDSVVADCHTTGLADPC